MWLIVLLAGAVVFIILATTRLKLHPFLALIIAAFGYGILSRTMSMEEVVNSVNSGFGSTIGYIGIVILAGCVIGTILEKSGGAMSLATRILKIVGEKHVPLAMSVIGFIVSIPVFCDCGFVILCPLAKALSRKAASSFTSAAIALGLGLYATHTMVPPTPGPVAAAAILNADLGLVILWGLLVSSITAAVGWLFAVKYASRFNTAVPSAAEPLVGAAEQISHAPSAIKSLLPILIPLVLIVLKSICDFPSHPFGNDSAAAAIIRFMGQPVVALLLGLFFALLLPRKLNAEVLSASGWVGQAVVPAAIIIIITGCGGAFGKVLQNSQISDVIQHKLLATANLSIWLPFIIAAALKTAQGSSTVAIITTAGIVTPLLASLGLETDTARALCVVAIGAGSMVASHANDSYFWVVTGLSGLNVKDGIKLQTLGTAAQGLAAGIMLWLISLIVL